MNNRNNDTLIERIRYFWNRYRNVIDNILYIIFIIGLCTVLFVVIPSLCREYLNARESVTTIIDLGTTMLHL